MASAPFLSRALSVEVGSTFGQDWVDAYLAISSMSASLIDATKPRMAASSGALRTPLLKSRSWM